MNKNHASAELPHRLKLALVPHARNHYHPHLIRWRGIIVVAILLAILQWLYLSAQQGSVLGTNVDVTRQALLDKTNQQRSSVGSNTLSLNTQLNSAAAAKAEDMFANNYWSHVSPRGVTPWFWIDQQNYSYSVAGENLAKNFTSPAGVITAWMNSPEHRKNMLDSRYREVGFAVKKGVLQGKDTLLVVALYGRQKTGPDLQTSVLAATQDSINILSRIGVGLQQLNPAALASIVILLASALIGLVAHSQRSKLPIKWRNSWRRHHGFYSSMVFMSMILVTIALYGTGQI